MWKRIPEDFRLPAAVLALGLVLAGVALAVPALGAAVPPLGIAIGGLLLAVFIWTGRMQKEQPEAVKALRRSCCVPVVEESVEAPRLEEPPQAR